MHSPHSAALALGVGSKIKLTRLFPHFGHRIRSDIIASGRFPRVQTRVSRSSSALAMHLAAERPLSTLPPMHLVSRRSDYDGLIYAENG